MAAHVPIIMSLIQPTGKRTTCLLFLKVCPPKWNNFCFYSIGHHLHNFCMLFGFPCACLDPLPFPHHLASALGGCVDHINGRLELLAFMVLVQTIGALAGSQKNRSIESKIYISPDPSLQGMLRLGLCPLMEDA